MQLFFLKSYEWSSNLKISAIISGATRFYISVNSTWIFLPWIVTTYLFGEVPENTDFIVTNKLKTRSYNLFIWLLIFLLWNIQMRGQ